MPTIEVDGVRLEVPEGVNLLHACLSHGLDLPYFCWHPSLGSVGACRQCAVVQYRDAEDTRGKLTMACMTPAVDGARLSVRADEAIHFRASVIEWLMLNHPHDCPVCEEGGECHLQDMTVMTGHTSRRYRGRKRTFRNQYLGPFIGHEMNRCITCYRCVRFYRDYAGATDLDAFGSRDRMYFGRAEDGVLTSEFAGNLVEVCPTGVFTDKTLSAHYTRKWDLTSAPSVCHGCSLGCNTLPGERYGLLKRVHNRYHGEINGYFLCDRGRFGAGFVNAEKRLRQPGRRAADGSFDPVSGVDALERARRLLADGNRILGIGSPRASLEANYALANLVGAGNFSPGLAGFEAATVQAAAVTLTLEGVRVPTLRDVEQADAVLILGEDVSNSAPRLALAVRQAVRNRSFEAATEAGIPLWQDAGVRGHAAGRRTPLLQVTVAPTRLDDLAQHNLRGAPERAGAVGEMIAAVLRGEEIAVDSDSEAADFARSAARILSEAERPLIVSGSTPGVARVPAAAGEVASTLAARGGNPGLMQCLTECNTLGVALLGGVPLEMLLERLARDGADTLVVLENDLALRADIARLEVALQGVRVIVLDSLETWTCEQADLVLPAATFAESDGTWVNNEGRAQRHYRVFPAADDVRPSWQWLLELARGDESGTGPLAGIAHCSQLTARLASERAGFAPLAAAGEVQGGRAGMRVPRQPHRYSGRTAMNADLSVHEPRTMADPESPLAFSMEGDRPPAPGQLLTVAWSPGWNSNQSIYKFQDEVGGALRGGDAGVRVDLGAAITALSAAVREGASPPPDSANEAAGGLRVVVLQDVFASDELSNVAPAIAQRRGPAHAVLAPADAERIGASAESGVRVRDGQSSAVVGVRLEPALEPGTVGLIRGATGALLAVPGRSVTVELEPDYRPPGSDVIARG